MNATENQVNYINILKDKAIAELTYDVSGWGFTARDLCDSFGIKILRAKNATWQIIADAIIENFTAYLTDLDLNISKSDASCLIDKFKNDTLGIEWLNLSGDASERVTQLNTLVNQGIVKACKNKAGILRVYVK